MSHLYQKSIYTDSITDFLSVLRLTNLNFVYPGVSLILHVLHLTIWFTRDESANDTSNKKFVWILFIWRLMLYSEYSIPRVLEITFHGKFNSVNTLVRKFFGDPLWIVPKLDDLGWPWKGPIREHRPKTNWEKDYESVFNRFLLGSNPTQHFWTCPWCFPSKSAEQPNLLKSHQVLWSCRPSFSHLWWWFSMMSEHVFGNF